MSKKRKLESLQQLGILKASDVKEISHKLTAPYRVEALQMGWHNLRWASLAVVVSLGFGSIAVAIGTAWRLSH